MQRYCLTCLQIILVILQIIPVALQAYVEQKLAQVQRLQEQEERLQARRQKSEATFVRTSTRNLEEQHQQDLDRLQQEHQAELLASLSDE